LSRSLDASVSISKLGWKGYRHFRSLFPDRTGFSNHAEPIVIPGLSHPIFVRPGSSDLAQVRYTLIREEFGVWLPPPPVRVIIDAGANIGDSSIWYLSKFTEARVIAIEPDPDNFALLEMNCRPYAERTNLVQGALWSKEGTVNLQAAQQKDAISVSAKPGVGVCRAVSVPFLMRHYNVSTIDIFKCDIEGAELEVFSSGCDEWLCQTRCLVVETHGNECLASVEAATRRHGFRNKVYRTLHIFHR
jgi:FkbM family methyltransferase